MLMHKLGVLGIAAVAAAGEATFTVEGKVCVEDGVTTTYASTVGVDESTKIVTSGSDIDTSVTESGLQQWQQDLLSETNAKRALHANTGALAWSSSLASYAQAYADAYACDGSLVHSGGPHGENLAIGYSPKAAVDAWYAEISLYDYANPDFSVATGHFTQLVWKDTTQVGCGIKYCGDYYGDYVICSYNPPGNYEGEFGAEVEPLA